jgi:hypothetical protein
MKICRFKTLLPLLTLLALIIPAASAQQPLPDQSAAAAPVDVTGTWTIYSIGGPENRTETKSVQLVQKGNQLSGHFKGPYQSGGIQGTIEGRHIVFHTKTRQVLNFRGQVNGDSIKGTWGTRGVPGTWEGRRTQ